MSRRYSTASTFQSQRVELGQRDDRTFSTASVRLPDTTDVVIPSNILSAITSGPFISNANQAEVENTPATASSFDVRGIAQQLQEETSRILTRSTSVSIAGLQRSRSTGRDALFEPAPEFRKTSLAPNFDSSLRNRTTSHEEEIRRHALPTVVEGQVNNRAPTNDYFGDYAFGARGPRLFHRTSSEKTEHRQARLNARNPSNASPMRTGSRTLSHDIQLNRVSSERSRRSTAVGSRKASVIQRSASVVLDTVDNVKQAIRRSSIYDVYEKAKKRGVELRRSAWAMRLFEYTFYLILIAFVYFVLIGLPLWKGAVYWLYWVFEHKFAIAGTW